MELIGVSLDKKQPQCPSGLDKIRFFWSEGVFSSRVTRIFNIEMIPFCAIVYQGNFVWSGHFSEISLEVLDFIMEGNRIPVTDVDVGMDVPPTVADLPEDKVNIVYFSSSVDESWQKLCEDNSSSQVNLVWENSTFLSTCLVGIKEKSCGKGRCTTGT